jgi:D-glycero-D-manno-heptose 1,7-bisphosphate phosphatase
MTPQKIIFIDRDGVINHDPIGDYIKKWKDFRFHDGVLSALKRLSDRRYKIIIISNQAGIGDGVFKKEDLDDITEKMIQEISKHGAQIEKVYYCLHGKQENCGCRKPKTGLFQQAASDYKFTPKQTYFIGDKLTDMQAGLSFGLKNILVLTGHGKLEFSRVDATSKPLAVFPDLSQAVDFILRSDRS